MLRIVCPGCHAISKQAVLHTSRTALRRCPNCSITLFMYDIRSVDECPTCKVKRYDPTIDGIPLSRPSHAVRAEFHAGSLDGVRFAKGGQDPQPGKDDESGTATGESAAQESATTPIGTGTASQQVSMLMDVLCNGRDADLFSDVTIDRQVVEIHNDDIVESRFSISFCVKEQPPKVEVPPEIVKTQLISFLERFRKRHKFARGDVELMHRALQLLRQEVENADD